MSIEQQLQKRILILDGAMGTMIQNANITAEDFGGEAYEGCNDYLSLTAPDLIASIHEKYLQAGADIISTNTFGATNFVLDEYNIGHVALELNQKAAEIARKIVDTFSTSEHPRFVAGSMGPTTKTLSVTGGITFSELANAYEQQALGLLLGGVDVLLLETCQDTLNVKAGYVGIERAFKQVKKVPIIVSGTIEPMGTTLAGQTIESFFISIEHMNPLAVGLNCATGPEFMTDHIRSLSEIAGSFVSCYPNAGLPDEEGYYHETPTTLAKKIQTFADNGWLNIVGGCCGTTPAHIAALAEIVKDIQPRKIPENKSIHTVSGIEALVYDETMRPLLVGERTNAIGSRKFKRLIAEEKYEEASEIARAQVKNGAHVIDICLADPDSDEQHNMEQFIQHVVNKVKVPLVIDSTDEKVMETALTFSQGKAIINSINLEDSEERLMTVVPLIQTYGAAVVVGTIDESGMGVTVSKKLEIATRSYDLLVNKYGMKPENIIFDPLVFPVGTGDQQYIGSAKATIEGVRAIKEKFPHCLTILGISNVSFGLPALGREVLNSVFLYHCTQAGLDYAIVNTEKLERFASIPIEEIKLAETLLFTTTDETLASFTEFFRNKTATPKIVAEKLTLSERLAGYVVEGTKEGLLPDLEIALAEYPSALAIINGPLMDGMSEVGKLFNTNQLIVAEVLQSAEVMKAAVQFLEPHMEKGEDSIKGKVLLATVKGDVHDIGKNLVDIILSNNGFQVVDLGIKVTPQQILAAVEQEKPDIIGLSGLLVKSAQQMVLTAQDLRNANISIPMLVGGAALSRKFTDNKISPEYGGIVLYAKDAMDGLALANQIHKKEVDYTKRSPSIEITAPRTINTVRSKIADKSVFIPSDLKRHMMHVPLAHIEPYINEQMLLGHHLGLKGKIKQLLAEKNEKALQLHELIQHLLTEARDFMKPATIYQFFAAQSEGNTIYVYDNPKNKNIIETFTFPRQSSEPHLCLADFIKPVTSGEVDYIGLFIATAGHGVRERAIKWKEDGEFLRSHAIQALALETAEGLSELVHQWIRDKWGFSDSPTFTMKERFSAKYQGQRFSFGYPACPNLEDQEKLFHLLQPQDIQVQLTDGFMMEPEGSVSAIVFAHPEARYFAV